MDLQTVVRLLTAVLGLLGFVAIGAAWKFGRSYQNGGSKKQKYFCVAGCVAGCVCIVTVVQIIWMFGGVL